MKDKKKSKLSSGFYQDNLNKLIPYSFLKFTLNWKLSCFY